MEKRILNYLVLILASRTKRRMKYWKKYPMYIQ